MIKLINFLKLDNLPKIKELEINQNMIFYVKLNNIYLHIVD